MTHLHASTYQVLIVEDRSVWSGRMKRLLAKVMRVPDEKIHVASTISDAKQKLKTEHYHFISMDMNMPESSISKVSVSVGSGFTNDLQEKYPCLSIGIYTAYSKDRDHALSIGMTAGRDIPVWEKSAGIHDSGLLVEAWADEVRTLLVNDYPSFCFRQAANYLPCHLAETASHIHNVINSTNKNEAQKFSDHAIHIWTLILQLATAQAMGLARSQKLTFSIPDNYTLATLEESLLALLVSLNKKNSIALWEPYLGLKTAPGGNNLTVRFLDNSELLRKQRNAHSHEVPLEDCRQRVSKMMPAVMAVMDAAIFWTSHPLVTDVQPCGGNYYKAKQIKGTSYPWQEQTFQLDPANAGQQLDPDHMYLRNSDPYSNTVDLVDLWPFVKQEFNSELNRPVLFLLSHRWKNNWYRISMINGKPEIWKPGSDELRALEAYC